jgi:hypothetical protein
MPIREDTPQSVADGLLDKQEDEVSIMPLGYNAYFYRMYRPWYLGEKRLDPIVASSNHINVFTINPDEAIVIPCNVGAMEVASKLVVLNSEEQEQKAIIQREVIVEDNVEFLQDGNWAVALFDPIKDENDLDRLWIFDMVSPKIGYALTDPDLLDDQANEGYRQSTMFGREKQVNVVNVRSVDYFATENKTSIKFILGEPIDLSDFNLQNISLERNGTHSIYTQIKLLGLDTDAMEKTFFNLQAELMPFLANVKRVGKEVELNNLWKKSLSFNTISTILSDNDFTHDSEVIREISSLLELPSSDPSATKTHNGYIISAPINFNIDMNTSRDGYFLTNTKVNARNTRVEFQYDKDREDNPPNINNIYYLNNTDFTKIITYSVKDKNDTNITWEGSALKAYSFSSTQKMYQGALIRNTPFSQVIIYDTDTNTQVSYNSARIKQGMLHYKYDGDNDNSDPNSLIQKRALVRPEWGGTRNVYNFVIGQDSRKTWSPVEKASFYGMGAFYNPGYEDPKSYVYTGIAFVSISGRGHMNASVKWNSGTEDDGGSYKIEVESNGVQDNMRLWNMLVRKIIWTKLYTNAFSGASYDNDTGLPLNFAALVKEKFTNTNYSPIDVITNIEKEYLTRYPDDKNTLQWDNYKKISQALSSVILSDTSIAGGLNEQNQILMPFYLQLPNKKPDGTDNITSIARWVDGENFLPNDREHYPIYLYGGNKPVDETKTVNKNPISGAISASFIETQKSDGTIIKNIPIYGVLKSKWFDIKRNNDLGNYPNNTYLIDYVNKNISTPASITTDDQEITFSFAPSTKELREGDFTEIPRDWSLNENYTNYLWNILLPTTDYQTITNDDGTTTNNTFNFNHRESLISLCGSYEIIDKQVFRKQLVGNIKDDLEVNIGFGKENLVGALPYQLIFNGTFGSQTDIRFDFSKDILNEDGTTTTETASIRIPNINIFNDSDDQVVETTLVL